MKLSECLDAVNQLLTFFSVSSALASSVSGAEGLLSFLLTALAERSRYLRVSQLFPLTLDLSVPLSSPHCSSPPLHPHTHTS